MTIMSYNRRRLPCGCSKGPTSRFHYSLDLGSLSEYRKDAREEIAAIVDLLSDQKPKLAQVETDFVTLKIVADTGDDRLRACYGARVNRRLLNELSFEYSIFSMSKWDDRMTLSKSGNDSRLDNQTVDESGP